MERKHRQIPEIPKTDRHPTLPSYHNPPPPPIRTSVSYTTDKNGKIIDMSVSLCAPDIEETDKSCGVQRSNEEESLSVFLKIGLALILAIFVISLLSRILFIEELPCH